MPRNGSDGTFTRLYDWTDDEANSIDITASRFDAEMDGMATALTDSVAKDGQTTMTGNLPMGTNKLTGLGDGSALTDSASLKQVQNSYGQYAVATGSSNAYAISLSPAVTAYAAGQHFRFQANFSNTGSATLAVNGLTAKTIKLADGDTLIANDLISGYLYDVVYDGTDFIIPNTVRKIEHVGIYVGTVDDTTYNAIRDIQYNGVVAEQYSKADSGTSTATFKINSTALDGTANSVSSAEDTQNDSTNTAFVIGDDLNVTFSSTSSCLGADCDFHLKRALSS